MNHSTQQLAVRTGLAIVLNAARAAKDGNDVPKSLAVVVHRAREVATISSCDGYSELYLLAAIAKHEYERQGFDGGKLVAHLSELIAGAQNALIELGERI